MRRLLNTAAALVALGVVVVSAPAMAASGDTLKTVKERGSLRCTGHNGSFLGFAEVDD